MDQFWYLNTRVPLVDSSLKPSGADISRRWFVPQRRVGVVVKEGVGGCFVSTRPRRAKLR